MKKKQFLGNPLNQEIAETIRQGQENAGEINVELIPLNRIDVDVDNPEGLGLPLKIFFLLKKLSAIILMVKEFMKDF